ncbi:hypothetical protein, partial [Stenotrophomonas maltophilia]|uniref:hypothetical protein n=1 Tax=Stenotrophomonas maltophilia TaxID=40324 RepID=UPI001952BEB6
PKPYNLDFRIPWTWLENEKTFEVCDGGGQSLGHTYFQTDDADQARQWITKQAALSFVRWVASTPERFKPG